MSLDPSSISNTTLSHIGFALAEAATEGDVEKVKQIIKENPITPIERGWAAASAAYKGHSPIVVILKKSGEIPKHHQSLIDLALREHRVFEPIDS